jgi:hypothetical protein
MMDNIFEIDYSLSPPHPDGLFDGVENHPVAIVAATRQPRIRRA